ncbi:hypothetical protein N9F34_02205 [Alphaproteobacteria bacterium]|nr:hypothetical protein [Alphaproteobacteria bacterium]
MGDQGRTAKRRLLALDLVFTDCPWTEQAKSARVPVLQHVVHPLPPQSYFTLVTHETQRQPRFRGAELVVRRLAPRHGLAIIAHWITSRPTGREKHMAITGFTAIDKNRLD